MNFLFPKEEFEAWQHRLIKQFAELVVEVDCEDCQGTGTTECDCCGADRDCETCGGTGRERLVDYLSPELYVQCIEWESVHLQMWVDGEPKPDPKKLAEQASAQGWYEPLILREHPLQHLLQKAYPEGNEATKNLIALFEVP